MGRMFVIALIAACFSVVSVVSYPADHREDTVLPFSLSPGNVNLETYYLDKYPQPGIPGGPLVKKPTSQMTPSPLDPAPVPPEAPGGNMFLVHKTADPHAVFRTRRSAIPDTQFGGHYYTPAGHSHHQNGALMGLGPFNEDNLHRTTFPRHSGGGMYEQHQQHQQITHYTSHQRQHTPPHRDHHHHHHHHYNHH